MHHGSRFTRLLPLALSPPPGAALPLPVATVAVEECSIPASLADGAKDRSSSSSCAASASSSCVWMGALGWGRNETGLE